MAATTQDVSALEHIAYRIREDLRGSSPWDRQGTHVVFQRELVGMHLLTAIELVVGHASDPDAKTPAAIKRPFTPKVAKQHAGPLPPKKADECPEHPGQLPPPFCSVHAVDSVNAWHDGEGSEVPAAATGADAARIAAGLPSKHLEDA